MSKHILSILKKRLDDSGAYGAAGAETLRNALKEELQFYVLNFIYHHPNYSKWVMYGGSALRIMHELNRMSVDLDFEVSQPVTNKFLEKLKDEIENYFTNIYGAETNFLTVKITNNRGLILKFHIGEELGLGHSSNQVHVKIDLNYFVAPENIVIERRPINHEQLSFVILTYNMGALMASKIVAIFMRGIRGVGENFYEEKGRDIYDLLWYMEKKVVPDFDYIIAKNVDIKDPRTLFDKLTLKMGNVSNKNLKDDLVPLFFDRNFIENWLENWLESYFKLVEKYKINTITTLANIQIHQDFHTDNFSFTYMYNTENGGVVRIRYITSDYWIDFREGNLTLEADKKLDDKIEFTSNGSTSHPASKDKLKQYVALFHQKTEKYFEKTNKIILGDGIITKVIRMTADKLNRKEQIVLNKSALLSCELDDLLR